MNTCSIKVWVIFDIFIYLILSREICERKKLISGQQPIWKLKNETCEVLCCVETSAKVDSWIWLVQFCAGRSSQDILLTLHTLRNSSREYSTMHDSVKYRCTLVLICIYFITLCQFRRISRVSIDVLNLRDYPEYHLSLIFSHEKNDFSDDSFL